MSNRQRFFFLLVAGLLTWIVALSTGRRLAYQLAYVITAALVGALVMAWSNLRGLRVTRVTPSPRSQVGFIVEEHLMVRNTTFLPKLWIELRDFSTLPGHRVSHVIPGLGPRRTYRWHARTLAIQRGIYRLGPMVLISSDPFGLFTFHKELPGHASLVIYPLIVPLPYFPLPQGRLPGGSALRRRAHYVTTNVSGVREYQPGDALNRIHWKTTARTGRLMSKEFELDPYADVWCVLDMHRDIYTGRLFEDIDVSVPLLTLRKLQMLLPPHSAEYAVAAVASIGHYTLRQDRTLGFITYAQKRHVIHPDRGERHRERLLETLARVQPRGDAPLQHVLASEISRFPRYSTLIVVTADWTAGWISLLAELRHRGIQPIVILIDSSTFGPLPSPQPLLPHLAHHNITTYLLRRDEPLDKALLHPAVALPTTPAPIYPRA